MKKHSLKNRKKTFFGVAIAVAGVISLAGLVQACSGEEEFPEIQNDVIVITLDEWCNQLFEENSILVSSISVISDGNVTLLSNSDVVVPRLKSSSEKPPKEEKEEEELPWIEYGKVCGVGDAYKFLNKMGNIYGSGCLETKADKEDSKGCRMMYHRACKSN